jgi:hypothetical protein
MPGARMSSTMEPKGGATMKKTVAGDPVTAGDVIEITGHSVGDAPRSAEVIEVIGTGEREHYRVRWEDGHESVLYPGEDAVVRHVRARQGSRAPRAG